MKDKTPEYYACIELKSRHFDIVGEPANTLQALIDNNIITSPNDFTDSLLIAEKELDKNIPDRFEYFVSNEYFTQLLSDFRLGLSNQNYPDQLKLEIKELYDVITYWLRVSTMLSKKDLLDYWNNANYKYSYSKTFKTV